MSLHGWALTPPILARLNNGTGLSNQPGSKNRAGFRRLRFSFFRQERTRFLQSGPVAQVVRAHA
jgi:hypothetical protein